MAEPAYGCFISKYRKEQLYGRLKEDVREVISVLCKYKDVEIVEGAVCPDYVHLCVCSPPKLSVSQFMGYLYEKKDFMESFIQNRLNPSVLVKISFHNI